MEEPPTVDEDDKAEAARLAWKRLFQPRDPVAAPRKAIRGRPPKRVKAPIEEIGASSIDPEAATKEKTRKKERRKSYSKDELKKAMDLVNKNPGEVGAISKLFNTPRTTLLGKAKRGDREEAKRGPKPLLNDCFEKLLADFDRSMDSLNMSRSVKII